MEKNARASSNAAGAVRRLFSSSVQTFCTGKSAGGVRSALDGRVAGVGNGPGWGDCAQTTTQHEAIRANALLHLVVNTVIIGHPSRARSCCEPSDHHRPRLRIAVHTAHRPTPPRAF